MLCRNDFIDLRRDEGSVYCRFVLTYDFVVCCSVSLPPRGSICALTCKALIARCLLYLAASDLLTQKYGRFRLLSLTQLDIG